MRPASGDELAERLFKGTIQALELFSVYVGKRLGLYSALATRGPLNAGGLAKAAGIDARYAREWLEQQAVAGFLEADDSKRGGDRKYRLPRQHARVLFEEDDAAHVAPLAEALAGVGAALPKVVEAYRSGRGVPYTEYGEDFRNGQGGVNRPAFLHDLPRMWLPAIPDVDARLKRELPARVADVGCGQGWAAIGVAEAYPLAQVTGFDLDAASIDDARTRARDRGSRARFEVRDAGGLAKDGPFDLILVLEALHDMSRPVEALRGMREALAPGGVILIADERVAPEFSAPGDEIERLMYGWSVVHCLPVSMAEQPSAALGTALRPATVEMLAKEAGLSYEVLPIENGLFRFYRLTGA